MSATLVSELEREDTVEYRSVFRMDNESFEHLLQLVTARIMKQIGRRGICAGRTSR